MSIFSGIKEKWRAEAEKTRGMPLRKKAGYFLFYYRFWLLGLIALTIALCYVGEAVYRSRQEIVLQGFFTNDDYALFSASDISGDYTKRLGLSKNQRVVFDDVMYVDLSGAASEYTAASNGKIIAYMATAELDFVVTSREVFEHYAAAAPMVEFDGLLSPKLLESLGEGAVISAVTATGEPAACGLDMSGSRFVRDCGYEEAMGHYVMFVPHTAPHREQLVDFIEYCFE